MCTTTDRPVTIIVWLSVFKGFKPRLVPEESYKRVNVEKVLSKLPQNMDSIIKFLKTKQDRHLVVRDLGVFSGPLPPKPVVVSTSLNFDLFYEQVLSYDSDSTLLCWCVGVIVN